MKYLAFKQMIFMVVLAFCFSGCATDESLFDDNLANDQFQWMEEDGLTEEHLMEGEPIQ